MFVSRYQLPFYPLTTPNLLFHSKDILTTTPLLCFTHSLCAKNAGIWFQIQDGPYRFPHVPTSRIRVQPLLCYLLSNSSDIGLWIVTVHMYCYHLVPLPRLPFHDS